MFSPVVPSISLSSTSVRISQLTKPQFPSVSLSSISVHISSPHLSFPRFHSVHLQPTSAHPTSISLDLPTQLSFSPHQLTKPQFPSVSLSSTSVHIDSPHLNIAVDLIQFNSIVASMGLTGLEILICCFVQTHSIWGLVLASPEAGLHPSHLQPAHEL